jgi:Flp pilus assembly protein TadG
MRLPQQPVRRGATLVESAVVLMVFLTLVLGMLDLGIAVLRYNTLSDAARQGAREAIVHGKLAPAGWKGGPWGPATIDVAASTTGIPVVDAITPLLVGFNLSQTRIKVEWPGGGNDLQQAVRVTVSSPYQPMMKFIFGSQSFALTASSTMPIAH